ncbi:MAG: hypothetical protein PHI91_02700 [Candidatus Pacebacteria bacterium]|jgi:uncharacterized membrane protein|nr:hypothetical protein [Candidatus Paceibacterota bacterium]MDD2757586.1 hypothetical protein [Candidatus Paceibacterota bacterium]MDD3283948.1 hypothetical protein [Candidatus Paceibacterota bacterium]MDD3970075.1 hypothetical protein [Candidatus Paceibacterota bacterium]MDD4738158.1 hypothetical protein [Candidatus Paceibacterota bacterium]
MKKIIGWILIASGILLVFGTIYSTYLNFTAQSEFPQIFTFEEPETVSQTSGGLEGQIGGMIGEYIKDLVPRGATTLMLNMFSWILLATFLVYSGSKLVSMGSVLIKKDKKDEGE